MRFTDLETNLPRFAHNVHRRTALMLNRMFGREENMWSNRRYHVQRLETPDDVLEAMVQTMTLPVELGYTDDLESWDGLVTRPEDFIGRAPRPLRPAWFARVQGAPVRTCLRHWVPRGVRRKDKGSWVVGLRSLVAIRVGKLRAEACESTPATATPSSSSPIPTAKDTPANFVRSSCPHTRIEKLQQHLLFQQRYPQSLAQWRIPDRGAIFPHGTYWMRVFHRALSSDTPMTAPMRC